MSKPSTDYEYNSNVEGVDQPHAFDPLPWRVSESSVYGSGHLVDARGSSVDFDREYTGPFTAKAVNLHQRLVTKLRHTLAYLEDINVGGGQEAANIRELLREV